MFITSLTVRVEGLILIWCYNSYILKHLFHVVYDNNGIFVCKNLSLIEK